jgi:pyruvate kinase
VLRQLILAGATTFRLNFSHGDHDYHQHTIRLIRQTAFELNEPVGILQDLQGPKIRLGKFTCGSINLKNGDPFILTSRKVECTSEASYVSYEHLTDEVPDGAKILLDDGKVEMRVEKIDRASQKLHCRVVVGGVLSSNKGVNFPGVYLSVKALTDKDKTDLMFGLDQGVDWVALSFVRNPQDIVEIKDLIANAGKAVPVIAKIEKHEAIEAMEEILTTQMLDSMANNPRPTRAEVSDVANAILDGTDAVMLSNETAVGKYPVEAVATMATIAERMEQEPILIKSSYNSKQSITNAISSAVSQIAQELDAVAIMTLTKTGSTARNVSKFRPPKPILAIAAHVDVARQLQLVWGVKSLLVLDFPSPSQTFQSAINIAQENQLVQDGDLVVMTAGTLQGVSGSTDLIKIEMVKAILGKGVGIGQASASGRARIAHSSRELGDFKAGDILVVPRTNADFVEMMRKASGIITEESSLTSHAAVIGMRLGVPVIVAMKDATQIIREGSIVTLDTEKGYVYSGSVARGNGNELF